MQNKQRPALLKFCLPQIEKLQLLHLGMLVHPSNNQIFYNTRITYYFRKEKIMTDNDIRQIRELTDALRDLERAILARLGSPICIV